MKYSALYLLPYLHIQIFLRNADDKALSPDMKSKYGQEAPSSLGTLVDYCCPIELIQLLFTPPEAEGWHSLRCGKETHFAELAR